MSLTPLSGNLVIEGALGSVLIAQNDRVLVVNCDGCRVRCTMDNFRRPSHDREEFCQACFNGARYYHSSMGMRDSSHVAMSTLIDRDREARFHAQIDALADDDLLSCVIEGMPFGEWSINGLRVAYYGEQWQRLNHLHDTARGEIKGMITTWLAMEGLISQQRPDVLLVLNGWFPGERLVWETGRRHGVRVLLYEGGQRLDTVYLSENTAACMYDVSDSWDAWRNIPLTRAENDHLNQVVTGRMFQAAGGYVYSPSATGNAHALRDELQLRPGAPLVVAFTNCTADSSVFGANTVYTTQGDFVNAAIAYAAAHPAIDLVIRVHPVEGTMQTARDGKIQPVRDRVGDGVRENWPEPPPNLRLIESDATVSSYDLIELAQVVMVYVTTVGIEATILGKPVINAGLAHYSHKGFTYSLRQPDELAPLLDRLIAHPVQPPAANELARRYLYLWMFRSMLPVPALRVDPDTGHFWTKPILMDDFARNRQPDFDRFVDYVHDRRSLTLPPAPWRVRDREAAVPLSFVNRSLVIAVPDWHQIDEFAAALLELAGTQAEMLHVQVLAGELPAEAAAQSLIEALSRLAPPERWPELDLLPGDVPDAAIGELCMAAHAVIAGRRLRHDDRLAGMAAHAGVPVVVTADTSARKEFTGKLHAILTAMSTSNRTPSGRA